MDRDSRERERGGTRSDVASLWIDFLLLPQKLEEHLAAGTEAIPTAPDLISMFLEQALVNHKAMLGNNSSANGAVKDAEAKGTGKSTSKTASLLCERAARVAVVMQYTLSDIEARIPSQLHQFVLLKALIKHDKRWSLLHQCDLHRWLIHKALQSHPVGSASLNAAVPINRLGSWIGADDLGEVLHAAVSGNGDASSCIGDCRVEEERVSVEFLEQMLHEEDSIRKHDDLTDSEADSKMPKVMANGGSHRGHCLSTAYRCQVMLDVAEVHFMRGRIMKAHELFSKCGETMTFLSLSNRSNGLENREGFAVASVSGGLGMSTTPTTPSVPEDRLAGFLIACKMLLGNRVEAKRVEKGGGMQEPCCVGTPSPTQWAVIACEQSRLDARKYSSYVNSQSDAANGTSGVCDSSPGKQNGGLGTRSDDGGRTLENSAYPTPSKRNKKRSHSEDVKGDLALKSSARKIAELDKVNSLSSERVIGFNESGNQAADLDNMHVGGDASVSLKDAEGHLPNRAELEIGIKKEFELEDRIWQWKTLNAKDEKNVGASFSEVVSRIQGDTVKKEPVKAAACGSEVQLFVDLKGDPKEDLFPKMDDCREHSLLLKQEKSLIRTFIEDILRGHLSLTYRLSIERDPTLSESVRSKLAACNVVRSVLEGAPVQSFLRTTSHFENSKGAVDFFMQLLLAVKVMQDGNTFARCRPCGADSGQNGRLLKLGFLKCNLAAQRAMDDCVSVVAQRVRDLAMYICCVIDKSWCWGSAVKYGLVDQTDVPRFCGQSPHDMPEKVHGSGSGSFSKAAYVESVQNSHVPRLQTMELSENDILLSFLQVETLPDIEALVGKMQKIIERFGADEQDKCSSLKVDVAAVLRRRALTALETAKDTKVGKRLYELALTVQPRDFDSVMVLWLLERTLEPQGQGACHGETTLPVKCEGDAFPTFGPLDFVILQLIEKEQWPHIHELCSWASSLLLLDPVVKDEDQTTKIEKNSANGIGVDRSYGNGFRRNSAGWQFEQKRLLQTLNVARAVAEVMPVCVSLQAAASLNHFNEKAARLSSTLSQRFEDLMCVLVGVEPDGQIQGTDETQWRGTPLPHPGATGVSLISKISNPRVLKSLASLTAGWLQRCHVLCLTPWHPAVERYGGLAGVTAGASLSAQVGAYSGALLRPRVSHEFGRDLFGVLLEAIAGLPGVVEGDREKGHRWLQGLADLAFEDEAYAKALRLYLQAGAVRSAHYCDRTLAMEQDIFTPWVIQRMIAACQAIGAGVQAAVLCQCLPVPDYESAFKILQENTLTTDRDATAYFECLWEIPILELLVHMHSKAGDEARVNMLIGLLQQPALNVHNPPAIRQTHIRTMGQRFLQRLAEELL